MIKNHDSARPALRTAKFNARALLWSAVAIALLSLSSCATTPGADPVAKQRRDAAIRSEAPGNYYIGRRYHTNGTRFWGYLRKPGQLWETAKLAIMLENRVKQPDRLPEAPESGEAHGYDHNREYRVYGSWNGTRFYDPNADLEVDVFSPTKFEMINETPGFLFNPEDRYDPRYLPVREARKRGY